MPASKKARELAPVSPQSKSTSHTRRRLQEIFDQESASWSDAELEFDFNEEPLVKRRKYPTCRQLSDEVASLRVTVTLMEERVATASEKLQLLKDLVAQLAQSHTS